MNPNVEHSITVRNLGESARLISVVESDDSQVIANTLNIARIENAPENLKEFVNTDGSIKAVTQLFVLQLFTRTGATERTIVFDTCVGSHKKRSLFPVWDNAESPIYDRMREAGIDPASVDTVVISHLHQDHCGGAVLDGTPAFKKARVKISPVELNFWHPDNPLFTNMPPVKQMLSEIQADTLQPLIDAKVIDDLTPGMKIAENVWAISTPGHTPDHMSFLIFTDTHTVLITGDAFHHPYQMMKPVIGANGDTSSQQAEASRLFLLALVSDGKTIVAGQHFAYPGAVTVTRKGDSYVPRAAFDGLNPS